MAASNFQWHQRQNEPQNRFCDSAPPLLVSEREAAAMLSISERALFALRKEGHIKAVTIPDSRTVRYSVETLKAWIKNREDAFRPRPGGKADAQ